VVVTIKIIMKGTSMKIAVRAIRSIAMLYLLFGVVYCVNASGVIEDSSATLKLRNYYFDRDYKDDGAQSASREWAQAFILNFTSGYTPGIIGFGLDAQGYLGVKLDSSAGRVGTGLLPFNPRTREPADEYSELGLTAKVKVSKTELLAGTLIPSLPVINASQTRLLPQTFRGEYIKSSDLNRVTFHLANIDRTNLRDSTDYQKLSVASPNGRFNGLATSDRFQFAGVDFQWSPTLVLKGYHGELEDMYRQSYYGFEHTLPIASDKIFTDFRYYVSREAGQAKAGAVDNNNLGVMVSYVHGAHKFGAGYMDLRGDTAMPYLGGSDPLVISAGAYSSEFVNAKERSWQLRYDYDFVAFGIPGLRGMLRYLDGSNIELSQRLGGSGLNESEKEVEISYVVQSGTFKNVSLRLRHGWYRNDFGSGASFRDDNELRVNVDYTIALW
jgi:hypothetical protein